MGKYNDIWTRVKGFEETKKTRKKKSREEKIKEVEGSTLNEEEAGYTLAGVSIKPGVYLTAHTPTASFVMMITMVKPIEK